MVLQLIRGICCTNSQPVTAIKSIHRSIIQRTINQWNAHSLTHWIDQTHSINQILTHSLTHSLNQSIKYSLLNQSNTHSSINQNQSLQSSIKPSNQPVTTYRLSRTPCCWSDRGRLRIVHGAFPSVRHRAAAYEWVTPHLTYYNEGNWTS